MNSISIYILLILIFLGLSKSFSPSENRNKFVQNELVISGEFKGAPLSIQYIDEMKAGFLIKTYYLKLKVIHLYSSPEIIVVRTSREFYEKIRPYRGMSIFRRQERTLKEFTTPMPPGTLYVGDPSYGHWNYEKSGRKTWSFHRAYRHLPEILGWQDFTPTYEFFKQSKVHESLEKPYFGDDQEFGREGRISALAFPIIKKKSIFYKLNFRGIFSRFIKFPLTKEK